jgi:hypothetical protein
LELSLHLRACWEDRSSLRPSKRLEAESRAPRPTIAPISQPATLISQLCQSNDSWIPEGPCLLRPLPVGPETTVQQLQDPLNFNSWVPKQPVGLWN